MNDAGGRRDRDPKRGRLVSWGNSAGEPADGANHRAAVSGHWRELQDHQAGMRVPSWLRRGAPLSTAVIILLSEGLRLLGGELPVMLVMLFATVVFSAAVGGTRGAVISGILASAYVAAGAATGIIDAAVLGPPLHAFVGLGAIIVASLFLGRTMERIGVFNTAIDDEIDQRHRSLSRNRTEIQREGEHEVLASIAAGESLDRSLDTLARVVEQILPESVCTVVLLGPDGRHLTHGAGPSVSEAYSAAIEGAAIGPSAGSCGTAMYLDRQVITPDISEDPKWDEWRPAAEAEGLRACWSQPIHGSDGRVTGSFAVYYRQPREPSNVALAVLSRMRNLAGIAIERYRSAEALRHREALYRATFEHAAVGIAHVAPDGRYIRVNPKFCELLGYSEAELQQMRVRDVTHPDDIERDRVRVDLVLKGDKDSYHVEKRYRRKGGSTLWVNLSSGAVRKVDGDVERFVVVVEDVSDARRLSEELTFQARHDALTGLINRNEFDRLLREYLRDVTRGKKPVRSATWTWTSSNSSTTRPATWRETRFCVSLVPSCSNRSEAPTPWRAWVAMSSASCCEAAPARMRLRWLTNCAERWRSIPSSGARRHSSWA